MQFLIGLAVVAVVLLAYGIGRSHSRPAERKTSEPVARIAAPIDGKAKAAELYAIANELDPIVNEAARPIDVVEDPVFRRGVALLQGDVWSNEELLGYFRGDNMICACLALEALASRVQSSGDAGGTVRAAILESLNDYVTWNRFFALRALNVIVPSPGSLSGCVLARLDDSWLCNAPNLHVLGEFLQRRIHDGESIDLGKDFETELGNADGERLETIENILKKFPAELRRPLLQQMELWKGRRIDREFLGSIGRLWDGTQGDERLTIIEHDAERDALKKLEMILLDEPRRSVILVGDHGVGKTTLMRGLVKRFAEKNYLMFEASAVEILAGQSYIGQLEERVRNLLSRLRRRPVVWFVPDVHMLRLAGQHQHSTTGLLDMLLPAIESGDIVVAGATTPTAYEQMVLARPRVRTAFETLRVSPLSEPATRDLVQRWASARVGGDEGLSVATRDEAFALAQQYLTDLAAPGNVLTLLDDTRARLLAASTDDSVRIGIDDVITSLSQLTGLPASVLFAKRVMGQPEAVDCLVDRIAMIKAGVTDPSRPFGVFLFAGPTGTGKTEIAKTLADYLFGSATRLLRLDMSELQTPESVDRLLGSSDKDQRGGALVDLIRKQPFSVILLDEFEKAHPNVWDLFLQLFDDGRLTDREGNTADFRNAIVILTSNLGGHVGSGAGVGFTDETGRFSEASVKRAVEASFRKEFLNRLDRVVVFRPLSRDVMGDILRKELAAAFQRRGLRNRDWAVEWDATAIEFLLEHGFTVDLGARPLRRAIERARLVVEFVDPNATDEESGPAEKEQVETGDASLEQVGLDPRGTPEELAVLQQTYGDLIRIAESDPWQAIKRDGLARMQQPGFWDAPDRFLTLGDIEYVDRIESGLKSVGSVLERLSGQRRDKRQGAHPRKLLGRLASQLFVMRVAIRGVLDEQPREAFVSIEPWSDGHEPSKLATGFARRIEAMYCAWADKRGMPIERLAVDGAGDGKQRTLFAVSGYAAYSLLQGEHGLHVWEVPSTGRRSQRAIVRVRVAAQPASPVGRKEDALLEARDAIAANKETPAIIRRYQEKPSPLVRDSASGWRSGRLDRVFSGEFDLLGCVRSRPRDGETSASAD